MNQSEVKQEINIIGKCHAGANADIQHYICYCRKQYGSFAAIYLHMRQKHSLSIKRCHISSMKVNYGWSGGKRKVIYQADQNLLKQHLRQSRDNISNIQKYQVQTRASELPKSLKEFLQIFESQNQYSDSQLKRYKKITFSLYSFYLGKKSEQKINSSDYNGLRALPLFFNPFMVDKLRKNKEYAEIYEDAKSILLALSKWLYNASESPYLAIENNDF